MGGNYLEDEISGFKLKDWGEKIYKVASGLQASTSGIDSRNWCLRAEGRRPRIQGSGFRKFGGLGGDTLGDPQTSR